MLIRKNIWTRDICKEYCFHIERRRMELKSELDGVKK
jgi:hypothetical protein